jgi:hypothetical protein
VGKIVGTDPEGYVARFQGNDFLLRTNAALETGQPVRAQLVEQDGELILRLMAPVTKGAATATEAGSSLDQRLSAMLTRLGLESTQENLAAARELVTAGLPVSRELLVGLAFVMSEEASLGGQLVQLTQLIRNLLPELADPSLSDRLAGILAILEAATRAPEQADLAARIRSFLADSGIFTESKLKILLESGATSEGRQQIAADLKFVLLRLRSLVSARSQDFRQAGGVRILKQIDNLIANALKLVRGQQAQNLALADMNQLVLLVPFLQDWGLKDVRIRFFQEEGSVEGESPARSAVLVEMDTTNLGRLIAVLRLHSGRIYCRFTAEQESVARLIRRHSAELREHLGKLPVTVAGITCGVGTCDYSTNAPLLQTVDVKA